MEHSASAPTFRAVGTEAAASPQEQQVQQQRVKNYNIKQYRGLLGNLSDIKSSVDEERRLALERQEALERRMKESEAENAIVQKELSVQLRCAGRSYQQLLGATRELTEQLRAEEDRRKTEIEALERQVKDLRQQLSQAAKPWKEEVSKRDLKIIKLQEAAVDQEKRLRAAEAKIAPIQERAAAEIKAREEKFEVVSREMDLIRAEYEKQLEEKDQALEKEVVKWKKEKCELLVQLDDEKKYSATIDGPYKKQIKELEMKVQGLESQLEQVDYTPLEEQLRKRELGYEKLVKDFRVKQQLNYENLEKMRAGFELTLERMDKKIQDNEKEHQRRLKPWQELVDKREGEILNLKARIEELKEIEELNRKNAAEELAETMRLLKTAREAEELSRREAVELRKEVAAMQEAHYKDNPASKITYLKMRLEEVTKQCEYTVLSKDRELKQKTDIIMNLQRRLVEEAKGREADDQEWDKRVQKKEEGYGLVVANLAYAEGQILEERGRTQAALETVRRRERSIERLKGEHDEELRHRFASHEALERRIREMEAEHDESLERFEHEVEVVRRDWEVKYDTMRAKYEDQVADLRVEMSRRDRQRKLVEAALEQVRDEYDRARAEWDDKERELEIMLRGRDRQITALKNEIEFINDSWEVKYNRLMGLFEKVQKKYEDASGPNGSQEAWRRVRDLKVENKNLVKEILELKEMIKKQKRQIRDLQLDYDILLKETADLIAEKERGMAELVGDMAKLEARLRAEIELKERLVKEMTLEKRVVVASFEGRIRALEQQIEAMRFTDRQDLLDTIDVWKRAYERACIERDDIEDHYKELLDLKDRQVQKMAVEYAEVKEEVAAETLKGQQALEECEAKWKKLQAKWGIEKSNLEQEIRQIAEERDQAHRERDRDRGLYVAAINKPEDPELIELREKVKEQEGQIFQVESGVGKLVEENSQLREELEIAKIREEQKQEDWEPQIRWRDERYEAMVREHETVKAALTAEVAAARETCKLLEEQIKNFPKPFEIELEEAEAKYAQSQAGLLKLSQANVHLKEEILDLKEAHEKDTKRLEDQLEMAASILKEIAGLGFLKSMSRKDKNNLEAALGVDIDGDGKIGR